MRGSRDEREREHADLVVRTVQEDLDGHPLGDGQPHAVQERREVLVPVALQRHLHYLLLQHQHLPQHVHTQRFLRSASLKRHATLSLLLLPPLVPTNSPILEQDALQKSLNVKLKSLGDRCFSFIAPSVWNSLPASTTLRSLPILSSAQDLNPPFPSLPTPRDPIPSLFRQACPKV